MKRLVIGPRVNRAIAATVMFTTSAGSLGGCGYILYPERRGQLSGTIDSGTMVMDLLWLLPGIIPGVVALIVDFSSGAIYVRGRTAIRLSPEGRVAVRLPPASKPMVLEVRAVTAAGRVVAHRTAAVGPSTVPGSSVELDIGKGEGIYLEARAGDGAWVRMPTPLEATPSI